MRCRYPRPCVNRSCSRAGPRERRGPRRRHPHTISALFRVDPGGTAAEPRRREPWAEGSTPEGPIKPDWWNRRWVPITFNQGNCHFLDLDPAPGGTAGQVCDYDIEGPRVRLGILWFVITCTALVFVLPASVTV